MPETKVNQSQKMLEILSSAQPFSGFTEEELESLLPALNPQIISCPKNVTLAEYNTPAEFIGIVIRGEVSAQRTTISGNVYVENVYRQWEQFGNEAVFSSPRTWPLSIITTAPSVVVLIDMKSAIEELESSPSTRIAYNTLVKYMDDNNKALFQKISCSAPDVRTKLLIYFDLMNDKFQGKPFRLRMKRDDLADYLGVGRSSLFRELARLRAQGIVEIDDHNMVSFHSELISNDHLVDWER